MSHHWGPFLYDRKPPGMDTIRQWGALLSFNRGTVSLWLFLGAGVLMFDPIAWLREWWR